MFSSFPAKIPDFYANLIDWNNPSDPLRLMVEPSEEKEVWRDHQLVDPIGDRAHEVIPGLIHRYPDRALLILTTHCGIHCRFCFRKAVIGQVRPVDWRGIISYLNQNQQIHEVIFSGGDPATLSGEFLSFWATRLADIKHLQKLRVHTRLPVVDPLKISDQWWQFLTNHRRWQNRVVLHLNHPREITSELQQLITKWQQAHITILTQTVLLKGVNHQPNTLAELYQKCAELKLQPHYLHHLDQSPGTDHFRVSISEGKNIYQQLLNSSENKYPIPKYVLDLPGGFGKTPIDQLLSVDHINYFGMGIDRHWHHYFDPAKLNSTANN